MFNFTKKKENLRNGNNQYHTFFYENSMYNFNYKNFYDGPISKSTPIARTTHITTPTATTSIISGKYPQNSIFKKFEGKSASSSSSSSFTDSIKFNKKLQTILICTVIAIILCKIIDFTVPYTKTIQQPQSLSEFQSYFKKRMEDVILPYFQSSTTTTTETGTSQSGHNLLISLVYGTVFTIFSWTIVFLDSQLPGVYPPTPFTPKSQLSYLQQKTNSFHLGYKTVIASGIIVTYLLYFGYFK